MDGGGHWPLRRLAGVSGIVDVTVRRQKMVKTLNESRMAVEEPRDAHDSVKEVDASWSVVSFPIRSEEKRYLLVSLELLHDV